MGPGSQKASVTWEPGSQQGAREPGSKGPGNLQTRRGQGAREPVRFREPGNYPVSQCGASET